jgi:hypothetical protein
MRPLNILVGYTLNKWPRNDRDRPTAVMTLAGAHERPFPRLRGMRTGHASGSLEGLKASVGSFEGWRGETMGTPLFV